MDDNTLAIGLLVAGASVSEDGQKNVGDLLMQRSIVARTDTPRDGA